MNRTFALALALTASGCVATSLDGDDTQEREAELTHADPTERDPWVVQISSGGRHCTASVLSPHWVLTAAHCIDVAQSSTLDVAMFVPPNGLRHLYIGAARYIPHPDWNPTCVGGLCGDNDSDDDIGLVHLTDGAIDIARTGTANLYDDDEEPWHGSGSRWFHLIGYGPGTPADGGSSDCDDASGRVKRIAKDLQVDVSGDDFQAHSPFYASHPCGGDSGSPWMFARGPEGAKIDLVFGVTSAVRYVFGQKMWSALVKPRFGWIRSTSMATNDPIAWYHSSVGSWQYRRAVELAH
jgi:hypothetical protein